MEVLIAHPARQHSPELAAAMQEAGWLESYLTMLPDARLLGWIPQRFLPTAVARNALERIQTGHIRVFYGPILLARAARRAGRFGPAMQLTAWKLFDRWVARAVRKSRPSVVVGFEMCCAETFAAAKEVGARAVLDAAAMHYRCQDTVLGFDRRQLRGAEVELRQRKQREIDLADLIVCCSEAARASYLQGGADAEKLRVNLLGCDTALFAPPALDRRAGPPKFVFAGTAARHKGADILGAAFAELLAEYPDAELHVAGDRRSAEAFFAAPPRNLVLYGKLSQQELAALLWRMDCLILPSRLESFGMVVVEALASGLPVLATSGVGAADAIKPGINGWVVGPGNAEALVGRMRHICAELRQVRAMRPDCLASAQQFDWRRYRARAVELIGSLSESTARAGQPAVGENRTAARGNAGAR